MRLAIVVGGSGLIIGLLACGDSTGSGGTGAGGAGDGAGAQGGDAQGAGSQGGDATGGSADGGNGTGGAGECVPSGTGSADDVDCTAFCEALIAGACGAGPSLAECEGICEELKVSCAGLDTFVDCAGDVPEWECTGSDSTPVRCKTEFESCVVPCLPDQG